MYECVCVFVCFLYSHLYTPEIRGQFSCHLVGSEDCAQVIKPTHQQPYLVRHLQAQIQATHFKIGPLIFYPKVKWATYIM